MQYFCLNSTAYTGSINNILLNTNYTVIFNQTSVNTNSYIKFIETYNIKNNENIENFMNTIVLNRNSYKIIEEMEHKLNLLKKSIKYR